MTYQLAIFDMAGTTIDDRDEVYRVLREATEREGARYSDEIFQHYMGTEKFWAIGNLLREGGIEPTPEIHNHAWEFFRAELARTYKENPPTPLPGIENMLKALHDKGIKIGLTTGFAREIVDIIISSMGWDNGIINTVVTGDEVEHGRPEPDQILAVMEKLGVNDKSAVISSGDTEADVRSAQAAGVTSVGVLTGHLTREQFESLGADHVLDSSANLLDIVGK